MFPEKFLELENSRILVTGASSGIGRGVATHLSVLGARVVITGRDSERLAETQASLSGTGHGCSAFDLADTEAIGTWFKTIVAEGGPFHGLVHCAGAHAAMPVKYVTPAHIDLIMRINVYSAVMLAKCFSQKNHYIAPASLVLVSSAANAKGEPGLSVYSASKAAIGGLTRSLAIELSSQGIRVNCVAPAIVESELTERFRSQLTDEQFAAIEAKHPLGLGRVRDISNTVAFLLSSASRWTTGSTLAVDGGYAVC